MFLKIFFVNFFNKIGTEVEPGEIFLFFQVQNVGNKIDIVPYFLNFNKFNGFNYIELETTILE